jgi:hypothetical protein
MATWPATAHELTQLQQALREMTPGRWQPPTTLLRALREGPLLEQAVGALPMAPEVLVVNATGRDHPRRAGLAFHLGPCLGCPQSG